MRQRSIRITTIGKLDIRENTDIIDLCDLCWPTTPVYLIIDLCWPTTPVYLIIDLCDLCWPSSPVNVNFNLL